MMHLYGTFSPSQIKEQKKSLHNSIPWLLIQKEENYEYLDAYFDSLLLRIGGLNDILFEPPELVTLLSLLQAARTESCSENFEFKRYRKLILDAHSLIDKIKEEM